MIALNVLPLLLLGLAWWLYRIEGRYLIRWRRTAFVAGLIAGAMSAAVLLSFRVQAYIAFRGTRSIDLDKVYPVFSMLCLGLLAAVLALFGRRFSRLLLLIAGFLVIYLWYIAALAVSP